MILVSKEKGIKKVKQNIIAGIVIILLVAGFAIFNIVTQKEPVEYFNVVGIKSYENTIIDEYRILKNLVKNSELKENMSSSTTYEKHNILEYFNEEYFQNKKVAVLVLYEDNSKEYIYGINDVIYNEARTEVTIDYHYKIGTFADTFANTWHNYMFVELEPTVENVNFVLNNSVLDKE